MSPTPVPGLPAAYADRVETVGARGHEAVLARPDGVIVWTGGPGHDPDGWQRALRSWLGEPVAAR